MIDTDPRKQPTPEAFGPMPSDIAQYKELLGKLENGEDVGFDPMFNAESVSKRLDDAIQGESGTLEGGSTLELVQQRYVAAALGFNVSPNYYGNGAIRADVEYPDATRLPKRPQRGDDGKFYRADGTSVSKTQADGIYAAHFIADHPETFKQPNAFQKVFERIREDASSGVVEIDPDMFSDDPRGARSFIRQAARLMGYKVGDFIKDDNGVAQMVVEGTRDGFDSGKPSFFDISSEDVADDAGQQPEVIDQEPPEELDRIRLNELIEVAGQPGKYFGKGVELTEDDRHQFDLIAARVKAYLEPLYEQSDWKEFMKLVDEGHEQGILLPFPYHKGINVPVWCINGGDDPAIKKITRENEHGKASGIQVPDEIFNTFHWKNTVNTLERNYRDLSNETIRGQSPRQLGSILKGLAYLVSRIEQDKK